MSYAIFYRSLFISLGNGLIIPVVESGSNNCTERTSSGSWRRARDWYGYQHHNPESLIIDIASYMQAVDAELQETITKECQPADWRDEIPTPEDVTKRWGYYTAVALGTASCSNTSWNSYRNFWKRAVQSAVSIEELKQAGIYVRICESRYNEQTRGKETEYPATTEDLIKAVRSWEAEFKRGEFYLDIQGNIDRYFENKKKPRDPAQRKRKHVEQYFILVSTGEDKFFVKKTSRAIKYTFSQSPLNKKFERERQAIQYADKLKPYVFIPKLINQPAEL